MNTSLILHYSPRNGNDSADKLQSAIQLIGAAVRITRQCWIIDSQYSADEAATMLVEKLGSFDGLIIAEDKQAAG